MYLQICVFAVGHVRLLLASAVSSHSLVEVPLIRFLHNIRLKKNENMKKKYNVKQITLWPLANPLNRFLYIVGQSAVNLIRP